jgi:hypothetical protein
VVRRNLPRPTGDDGIKPADHGIDRHKRRFHADCLSYQQPVKRIPMYPIQVSSKFGLQRGKREFKKPFLPIATRGDPGNGSLPILRLIAISKTDTALTSTWLSGSIMARLAFSPSFAFSMLDFNNGWSGWSR